MNLTNRQITNAKYYSNNKEKISIRRKQRLVEIKRQDRINRQIINNKKRYNNDEEYRKKVIEDSKKHYKNNKGKFLNVSLAMYKSAKYQKRKNINSANYSLSEFREWLMKQEKFNDMLLKWVESDFNREIRPSVDRIDDYGHYTLDNIQLLTLKENLDKLKSDKRNGINNKQSVEIYMKLNGVKVKTYYSIIQAARELFEEVDGYKNVKSLNAVIFKSLKSGKEVAGYTFEYSIENYLNT